MAGTINEATSSLASELLLNKIMNGQVQTSTGKTVTAAGRAVSSRLSSDAYELRTAEKNMAYGEGMVTAAQTQLTGIRDQLNSLKKNLLDVQNTTAATSADFKAVGSMITDVYSQISAAIAGAEYNGQKLLNSTTKVSLNAGNGMSIKVLGYKADTTVLKEIKTKGASVKDAATAKTAAEQIDTAIDQILKAESRYGESIKGLQNQQLILEDQGASMDAAAAGQSIAANNGASNLLAGLLGETKA